jgi:tryptophan synthase alpha chain
MPFTDPMADGVTIQDAGRRALLAGQTLQKTLDMVREFRQGNTTTPVILMGYFNPIYRYGIDKFVENSLQAGVDGLIIVDLPIEEDHELRTPADQAGLDFIRLTTPTTKGERLQRICQNSTGFIYHIGIAGITGAGSASQDVLEKAIGNIRQYYDGAVCVGFGIKTPEDVQKAAQVADGVVVGSAIIERIARGDSVDDVGRFVESLRVGVKRKNKEVVG